MAEHENLWAALFAAQKDARRLPKDGTADLGKGRAYPYPKAETIIAEARRVLHAHGLICYPVEEGIAGVHGAEGYALTCVYELRWVTPTLTDAVRFSRVWGISLTRGRGLDKATLSAETTGFAYFLKRLLFQDSAERLEIDNGGETVDTATGEVIEAQDFTRRTAAPPSALAIPPAPDMPPTPIPVVAPAEQKPLSPTGLADEFEKGMAEADPSQNAAQNAAVKQRFMSWKPKFKAWVDRDEVAVDEQVRVLNDTAKNLIARVDDTGQIKLALENVTADVMTRLEAAL